LDLRSFEGRRSAIGHRASAIEEDPSTVFDAFESFEFKI